ncbi:MAG: hypothetical protein LBE76_07675 [Nitrososphaerota archaeon]|jgi:hypothetical protein|nr:hypothetical protein [Nitrososphaerota archaeon]
MRLNFTRFGLILIIIGVVLLSNSWTAFLPTYGIVGSGEVESGETLGYSVFMSPVGLGNFIVGYNKAPDGRPSTIPIEPVVVVPVHLVIVSPSNVTLVDVEVVTPYSVQIDFDERGKYTVYATNMGDERSGIPIGLSFPQDDGVTHREADKFLVSIILTASGAVFFCLGLSISVILKHKKELQKIVDPLHTQSGNI